MGKRRDRKGVWPVQMAVDRSVDRKLYLAFLSTDLSTTLCTEQGPFPSLPPPPPNYIIHVATKMATTQICVDESGSIFFSKYSFY